MKIITQKIIIFQTSPDNNVTTSILKYSARMGDNQKYLTCRAENPKMPATAKEDGLKLNIYCKYSILQVKSCKA